MLYDISIRRSAEFGTNVTNGKTFLYLPQRLLAPRTCRKQLHEGCNGVALGTTKSGFWAVKFYVICTVCGRIGPHAHFMNIVNACAVCCHVGDGLMRRVAAVINSSQGLYVIYLGLARVHSQCLIEAHAWYAWCICKGLQSIWFWRDFIVLIYWIC
jgi:hypothetical protein